MVLALAEILTSFITTIRNKAAHRIFEISEDSMIMRSHMSCPIWYCAFGLYCPLVFHIISISFATWNWWCDLILLILLFWIKAYFYILLNIRRYILSRLVLVSDDNLPKQVNLLHVDHNSSLLDSSLAWSVLNWSITASEGVNTISGRSIMASLEPKLNKMSATLFACRKLWPTTEFPNFFKVNLHK